MNYIDWNNAPDNTTHYVMDLNDGSLSEFVIYVNESSLKTYISCNGIGSWSEDLEEDGFKVIPKPSHFDRFPALNKQVTVPTFTPLVKYKQGDKIYLISALYEFKDECDSSWELGRLVDIDGSLFRSDSGHKREWYAEIREISIDAGTITNAPIELIDGKAYQFEYKGDKYTGIYSDIDYNHKADVFIIIGGHVMVSYCTNIKLLKVKSESPLNKAAPDMYEFLKSLLDDESMSMDHDEITLILKKARGE